MENNVNTFQKIGGIAALVEACIFIIGFILYFTLLASAQYGSLSIDPLRNVKFLVEHKAIMHTWNFTIYVVFGIFLVVLTLALHERLKKAVPVTMQIATAFGLIWAVLVIASGLVANVGATAVVTIYEKDPAQAISVWLALQFVVNGLGGGNEIIGGLWVLLISLAGLNGQTISRPLNVLGLIVGAAGVVTAIPALSEVGSIFGLGLILWFAWVGIVMLRTARIAS